MPKKKQILYPVFFMLLVTVIFTSGLAVINELTIDKINDLEAMKTKKSILYASDLSVPDDQVNTFYAETIKKIDSIDFANVYKATVDNEIKAYIYEFSGPGLWGQIIGYAALSPSLDKIIGIDFLSHSETPGLGGRISEAWYKEQFRNILLENRTPNYISYAPANDSNVDAVTGATLTSDAVRKILNETIQEFIDKTKGVL
ncbi:MAG: FMN-binding protein [Clostridiales bacterium]|nr:FMN-binding protein [Clostridiales bacterium]